MTTSYPTDLDTWTSKTNNVDDFCASHINNLQDSVEALESKVGITDSGIDTTMSYKVHTFFDNAGTRTLYLYENTAPTGWTTVSAASDVVIAVRGGSKSYNASGGTVNGTWLQPSHTLITSELPQHRHSYTTFNTGGWFAHGLDDSDLWYPTSSSAVSTGSTGGSGIHRHGTNTYRPYATIGIIVRYNGE